MGTSSLWKIPAAKAASALVFSKTSVKCSSLPAPEDAITGIETLSRMWLMSSMSMLRQFALFLFYRKGNIFYFISGCDTAGNKCQLFSLNSMQ